MRACTAVFSADSNLLYYNNKYSNKEYNLYISLLFFCVDQTQKSGYFSKNVEVFNYCPDDLICPKSSMGFFWVFIVLGMYNFVRRQVLWFVDEALHKWGDNHSKGSTKKKMVCHDNNALWAQTFLRNPNIGTFKNIYWILFTIISNINAKICQQSCLQYHFYKIKNNLFPLKSS